MIVNHMIYFVATMILFAFLHFHLGIIMLWFDFICSDKDIVKPLTNDLSHFKTSFKNLQ